MFYKIDSGQYIKQQRTSTQANFDGKNNNRGDGLNLTIKREECLKLSKVYLIETTGYEVPSGKLEKLRSVYKPRNRHHWW